MFFNKEFFAFRIFIKNNEKCDIKKLDLQIKNIFNK